MKALARKELVELVVPFGPVLVLVCSIWLASFRIEQALIGPLEQPMSAVLLAAAGAGLLLASLQLGGERIRGTWGYLIHRGAGVEGCFRTKAWTGATTSMIFGVLPPLVLAIVHATILGDARVVQWSRVGEYFAIATAGASSYAITAFVLSFRRRFWATAILALVGVAGWLVLCVPMTFLVAYNFGFFPNDPAILAGFAALQIGVAVLVLWLAERILASWRDAALSLASTHHVAAMIVGVFLWIPLQLLLFAEIEHELDQTLLRRAPLILQDRTKGDLFLAVPTEDDSYAGLRDGRVVQDERLLNFHPLHLENPGLSVVHSPERPSVDRRRTDLETQDRIRTQGLSWDALPRGGWGRDYELSGADHWVSIWLDRCAGRVRQFALRYSSPLSNPWIEPSDPKTAPLPEVPFERIIEKPGRRFSKSTVVLNANIRKSLEEEQEQLGHLRNPEQWKWRAQSKCIVDLEDGSLWEFEPDFTSPLRKLELPNDDRVVGVGAVSYHRESLRVGQFSAWFQFNCVRGEKGMYDWNGTEFVAADLAGPENDWVAGDVADSLIEIQAVYTDTDPLYPTVEVRDARSGAVLMTHHYAPLGFTGTLLVGALHLAATLHPVVVDLHSYFRSSPVLEHFNPTSEPLLMNHSRPWLLGLALLLSIGLAIRAVRRARERDARPIVVALTALIVATLGVSGFFMIRMLQSRRSPRRAESLEPRAEPVVLIETARAT